VWEKDQNISVEIFVGGSLAALIVAPLCFAISSSIFENFTTFATIFSSAELPKSGRNLE